MSVIIPVLDDAGSLQRCLAALALQDFPGEWEVIVVDNGSQEDIAAVAATLPQARVLREPRTGSYAARNAGLAVARGATIAFTDADCVPASDWLRSGADAVATHARAGAIAGSIEVFAQGPGRRTAAELYDIVHAFPQQRYVDRYGFGVTANLFTTRRVIEQVGRFDASLRSGGDAEWGQRLVQSGLTVVYDPRVHVRHPARRTLGEVLRKTQRVIAGREELHRRREGAPRTLRGEFVKSARSTLAMVREARSHPQLGGLWDRSRLTAVVCVVQFAVAAEALRQQRRQARTGA